MVTDTTPKGPESWRVIRGLVLLLAALLLIAAIYYYFVPVHVASKEGVFGCGSASNPPSADKDGFQYGACQKSAVVNQFRTYALLGGAVVTALAGFLLFRTPRSDWEDEDIDLADGRRGDAHESRRSVSRSDRARPSRADDVDDSRGLRGVRRDESPRRVAADDEPIEQRRDADDDWDRAVQEPASSGRGADRDEESSLDAPRRSRRRRDDDFLDDELDEEPVRRTRRRRDDDF